MAPAKRSGGIKAFLGKAMFGLFGIALLLGLLNRLISGEDPSPDPAVVANLDPQSTRAAKPRATSPAPTDRPDRTKPPLSNTPAREPTERASTARLPATRTPTSARPTVRVSITPDEARPTYAFLVLQTPGSTGISARAPVPPTETPVPQPQSMVLPTATDLPPTATQIPATATVSGLALAATDCSGYDAWEWAQSVYETDRVAFAALDPDGDGIACPNLDQGFAPAFWTTALPDDVVPGTLSYVVDGDTFEIEVNGQSTRYRLYRADTPETQNASECGGSSATEYAQYVLSFSDTPGQVWVESIGQRDGYGRTFAYLWITVAGEPYLLNHILINNGWAEDIDYGDAYDPYRTQLRTAANFASNHQLGVWNQCGGFGVALPTQTPHPTAPPMPTRAPFVQPTQAPAMNLGGGCDPNYTPCVPNVSYDLNCPDIGYMTVQVIGNDRHGFDRDNDGWGCE